MQQNEYLENGGSPDAYREQGQKYFRSFVFSDGESSMPFRMDFPDMLEPGRKYPLVLFLHGAGSVGNDNILPLYMGELFASHPDSIRGKAFIVVPQCPGDGCWIDHGDSWSGEGYVFKKEPTAAMEVLLKLMDYLPENFPVDIFHMAVGGCSMGGYGTWDILSRRPGRFRAAFPICGCGDSRRIADYAGTALWFFHGALDPVVSVDCSRRMAKALDQTGYPYRYIEFADVKHGAWDPALRMGKLHGWLKEMLLP